MNSPKHILCASCNKPCGGRFAKTIKCTKCEASTYCSTDCQNKDSAIHQLLCEAYKPFLDANPRPSENHKLAILLPTFSWPPIFTWVKCEILGHGKTRRCYPEYEGNRLSRMFELEPEVVFASAMLQAKNSSLQKVAFDHLVEIVVLESDQSDKTRINLGVEELMKLKGVKSGKQGFVRRGPLLILAQPGTITKHNIYYQDTTLADLGVVAEFLLAYGPNIKPSQLLVKKLSYLGMHEVYDVLGEIASKDSNIVKAVDISSKGDRNILGKLKYVETEIQKDSSIFTTTKPTSVSAYMGLPLLVKKYGNFNPEWMKKYQNGKIFPSPFMNRNSLFLNIRAEPIDDGWGFADIHEWDIQIGTVLVARQDKKPITLRQVEALARFCRYELCPAMEYAKEVFYCSGEVSWKNERERKKHLLEMQAAFVKKWMCRTTFDQYFYKLKGERLAAGDASWEHEISPYEFISCGLRSSAEVDTNNPVLSTQVASGFLSSWILPAASFPTFNVNKADLPSNPAFSNDIDRHSNTSITRASNTASHDEPYHNLVCLEIRKFVESSPRPTKNHYLGLLFPEDEEKPKPFWLRTTPNYGWSSPQCGDQLGNVRLTSIPISKRLRIANHGARQFDLKDSIQLYLRDEFQYYGSQNNTSVMDALGEIPGLELPSSQRQNSTREIEAKKQASTPPAIPVTKPASTKHEVSTTTHPIFKDTKPSPISVNLGIPLLIQNHGNFDRSWEAKGDAFENQTALYLNLITDPQSDKWGFTDLKEWDQIIGGVLVVREDRKSISPYQVEALSYWCQFKLSTAMMECESQLCHKFECSEDEERKVMQGKEEFVKKEICREKFEEFFEDFKKEKVKSDAKDWADVVSPYSV
ncbi:hypothetical protein G7Y89_g7849 [Cudoniella acicularis]|uniref:MYND-type domain-containing protein n=1 Tax=Cudoniella acicularis TaxID=354080 RepID=A0A8H4RHQ9_9HELO|nr:hypothetical protein G7Y89_g7849 [Cudoniella acicularis]